MSNSFETFKELVVKASCENDEMKKSDILKKIERLSGLKEDIHNIYWLKYKLLKDQSYKTIKEFLEMGYIKTILEYLEERYSIEEKDENDNEKENGEEKEEDDNENHCLDVIDKLLEFLLEEGEKIKEKEGYDNNPFAEQILKYNKEILMNYKGLFNEDIIMKYFRYKKVYNDNYDSFYRIKPFISNRICDSKDKEIKKRMKIKVIKNEDKMIIKEFIDKIKTVELLNLENVMLMRIEEIINNKIKINEEEMECNINEINIERNDESLMDIMIKLVNGLENLHKTGIIHGNINPNNILCNKNDEYKYDDYGMNKMRDTNELSLNNIKYINRELLLGKEETSKSDIFNLGLIFHKLVSGSDLLNGKSIKEVNDVILNDNNILKSIESNFQRVIEKMLNKDVKIELNEIRIEFEEIIKNEIDLNEIICEMNFSIDFYENNGMIMTVLPILSICRDKTKYFYEMIDLYRKCTELDCIDLYKEYEELDNVCFLTNFIWHNNGNYIYKKICYKELYLSEDGYESHESTEASMIRGTYNNFTLVFYGSDNDDNYSELALQLEHLTLMKRLFLINEDLDCNIVDNLSILRR